MLATEKIVLPVTIALPEDWKDQVAAVASLNGLDAAEISKLPPSQVVLSLHATAKVGSNEERFDTAVKATLEQLTEFLTPPAPTYEERLKAAAQRGQEGLATDITGRELLSWFGASRRGARVVEWIRAQLARHGLETEPDFNEVWVDVPLKLKPIAMLASSGLEVQPRVEASVAQLVHSDPVQRIGRLPAANQALTFVAPETPVSVAMTTMMLRDYSQVPVIRGERECKGAVSWQSIGQVQALGGPCVSVEDCMVPVEEVSAETSLLDAIPKIMSQGFVLVRGRDRRFQGIVTVSDLSLQFRLLSEPFLLLGQIENYIRVLVRKTFSVEEMREAKNPTDADRIVNDVSDLTFGEYVRLLEPAAVWPKLRAAFARDPFLRDLREILAIRNDVMHFDPEPLEDARLALLRNFAAFLERAVVSRADGASRSEQQNV